ncbi:MAG: hypothetical protein KGZ30_01760 [Anaplasmataceae bacterium]|nr:hypothetical protein [Anaplasmataceae bacterium]
MKLTTSFVILSALFLTYPTYGLAASSTAPTPETVATSSPTSTQDIDQADQIPTQLVTLSTSSLIEKIKELHQDYKMDGVRSFEIFLDGQRVRGDRTLTTALQSLDIAASPVYLQSDDGLLLYAAKIVAEDSRITSLRVTAQRAQISYAVTGKILGVIETSIPFTIESDLTEEVLHLSLITPWWNFAAMNGLGDLSLITKTNYDTQEADSLRTLTFKEYLRYIQAKALELTSNSFKRATTS